MQKIELKPGEKIFITKVEKHPQAPEVFKKGEKEVKKFLKERIEEIKKEIMELPEVKLEEKIHKEESPNLDLISEAVNLSLEKEPSAGIKFILAKGDEHEIDLFHDILVGHFWERLKALGKVKEAEEEKKGTFSKILMISFFLLVLIGIVSAVIFLIIKNK
jgi:hypothetical protein